MEESLAGLPLRDREGGDSAAPTRTLKTLPFRYDLKTFQKPRDIARACSLLRRAPSHTPSNAFSPSKKTAPVASLNLKALWSSTRLGEELVGSFNARCEF
ncbi:hypothetical protein Zmor_004516 [Zophobas morio]|uniref:Uncharacterized protein n=1 Tax=Zophobas morio TaxID=2755281 RepID=A0AA38HIT3_9CUCU|nr:hypothetical protein Zmor_004516 [Zophobas morio]